MSTKTVCRICLAMDVPMHNIADSPLQDIYEKLTTRTLNSVGRPVVACFICYSHLSKCRNLMIKAVQADDLLTQILRSPEGLQRESVANIDRYSYNLVETGQTGECNMTELGEVKIKSEPEPYPVDPDVNVEVNVKQEILEDYGETKSVETEYILEIIKNEVEDAKESDTNSKKSDQRVLRSQHSVQGETSGCVETTSTKSKKVRIRKSKVEVGNKEKIFECTQCTYKGTNRSNLKAHLRVHSEKTLRCEVCKKEFRDKSNFRVHQRIHTGEKPFECTVCHCRFNSRGIFKQHLKTHTGEKPYECDTCQSRFSNKSAMLVHFRKHTGEKPYQCTICEDRFKNRDNLKLHLRRHTGEKPFECTTCQRRFTQKYALVKHIRVHTGEKPYECTICQQKYREKGTLTIHLKTHVHSRIGTFQCEICQQKFNREGNLEKHLKKHNCQQNVT